MYPPEYVSHSASKPGWPMLYRDTALPRAQDNTTCKTYSGGDGHLQVDQIPIEEFSLTVPPGRTHMYYTGVPEFQFGDGMSVRDQCIA
jgi:hypothetical protein